MATHRLTHPAPCAELYATTHSSPQMADMPLDYTAFCLLHRAAYVRYAHARTGDAAAAAQVVHTAFTLLAVLWSEVLSSACPAGLAWRVLGQVVAIHAHSQHGRTDSVAHQVLDSRLADVVLLRHHLGLPAEEAADLMGVEASQVRVLLQLAERKVPGCLAEHLGLRGVSSGRTHGPRTCAGGCFCSGCQQIRSL